MKELVVISGKGGTGKTSIVASFAALAKNKVLADCDVDAADLHLVLAPQIEYREDFSGGKRARIIAASCTACGDCLPACRFHAIKQPAGEEGTSSSAYRIDPVSCEGCGVCVRVCPSQAIAFEPAVNGQWYRSRTRHGPLIHAKLGIAEENSGKLVTLVRNHAKEIAERNHLELIIIDGSPGIGCPVIASVTGANLVLVVTEPTLSGRHDLERVADLTKHFGIETLICINKWDLNPEMTADIERLARQRGIPVAGKVRYDNAVTEAQIRRLSVVEYAANGVADDIKTLWTKVALALETRV
ncbi:MAG: 4Fe-4S binding protein [Sedimentisphaerales bacterium]|nr:4Fe-4S binding protein [Sedimentisphaerales bacterium]